MNKTEWKDLIKHHTEQAGTFRAEFAPVIDALSEILEQRDRTYQEFIDTGAQTVVEVVSDRGAVNERKNPRLQVWMDLNTQALAFWRDLGLTAAGLKRINENAMEKPKLSALAEAMRSLERNGKEVSNKSRTVRKKGSSGKVNSRKGSKTGV